MTPDAETSKWTLLEQRLGRRWFCVLCAAIGFITLQLMATPLWFVKLAASGPDTVPRNERLVRSYLPIAAHPLSAQTPLYPASRLRILGPAIGYLIGMPGPASAFVPWLAALPAMVLGAVLLRRVIGPRETLLGLILFGTIHPFATGNCWPGYQDSLAILFVLAAMWLRPAWAVLPCLFVGMLADERAIVAIGLVVCWHALFDSPETRRRRAILRLVFGVTAVVVWGLYAQLLLRHLGMTYKDLSTGLVSAIFTIPRNIPTALFAAFNAAWLLPVMGAGLAARSRATGWAVVLALSVFAVLIAAVQVADMTRVAAFALPALLVGVALLARFGRNWLWPVLVCVMTLNLLMPITSGVGDELWRFQSAPWTLILHYLHAR